MPFRHRDAPFLSQFPNLQLLRQDGSTVTAADAFRGKRYVLIYFSAHWCPPCQRFTPLLADFYDAHREKCELEVLFVSSDREEGRMMDFFQNRSSNYVRRAPGDSTRAESDAATTSNAPVLSHFSCEISSPEAMNGSPMQSPASDALTTAPGAPSPHPLSSGERAGSPNRGSAASESRTSNVTLTSRGRSVRVPKATGHGNWLALPFKEVEVARFLSRAYSVVSIPKLVVVATDTSGMVTREGKTMVMKDPDALKFPWRFAEGTMTTKSEGRRECIALFLVLIFAAYYYLGYW